MSMDNNYHQRVENQLAAISPFDNIKALVIGDIMLDRYITGSVSRISPEAPVPVVQVIDSSDRVGGAANVAANLAGLGLETSLAGLIGNDQAGSVIVQLCKDKGIDTKCITRSMETSTTTKVRIVGNDSQMVRLDVDANSVSTSENTASLRKISTCIYNGIDLIIISDYAKGVVTESLCESVIGLANQVDVPVFVDPKGADFSKYAGATTMTPNRVEFEAVFGGVGLPLNELAEIGRGSLDVLDLKNMVITLNRDGALLICRENIVHAPAQASDVYDVSGAGDTVIATLAACIASGKTFKESVALANEAAAIVVNKRGTAPIVWGEVADFLPVGATSATPTNTFGLS